VVNQGKRLSCNTKQLTKVRIGLLRKKWTTPYRRMANRPVNRSEGNPVPRRCRATLIKYNLSPARSCHEMQLLPLWFWVWP